MLQRSLKSIGVDKASLKDHYAAASSSNKRSVPGQEQLSASDSCQSKARKKLKTHQVTRPAAVQANRFKPLNSVLNGGKNGGIKASKKGATLVVPYSIKDVMDRCEKLKVEILDVAHMEVEEMEMLGRTLTEEWMKNKLTVGHDDWETNASWVSTAYNICLLRDRLANLRCMKKFDILRKWGVPEIRIKAFCSTCSSCQHLLRLVGVVGLVLPEFCSGRHIQNVSLSTK